MLNLSDLSDMNQTSIAPSKLSRNISNHLKFNNKWNSLAKDLIQIKNITINNSTNRIYDSQEYKNNKLESIKNLLQVLTEESKYEKLIKYMNLYNLKTFKNQDKLVSDLENLFKCYHEIFPEDAKVKSYLYLFNLMHKKVRSFGEEYLRSWMNKYNLYFKTDAEVEVSILIHDKMAVILKLKSRAESSNPKEQFEFCWKIQSIFRKSGVESEVKILDYSFSPNTNKLYQKKCFEGKKCKKKF